jgi:hypothetical protein
MHRNNRYAKRAAKGKPVTPWIKRVFKPRPTPWHKRFRNNLNRTFSRRHRKTF